MSLSGLLGAFRFTCIIREKSPKKYLYEIHIGGMASCVKVILSLDVCRLTYRITTNRIKRIELTMKG